MSRTIAGVFWVGLYLLVVLLPVFLMLVPPTPSGRGFWLEFAVALGFVGLTQIAIQFVLIARFRQVTAPYGIDIILRAHRQIAMVAVAAILLHPTIIVLDNPSRLELFNPFGGNLASRMAWISVASLLLLVVSSVFRETWSIRYEWWRFSHLVLGVVAIVFAQLHVSMAGLYTNTVWKQAIWVVIAAVIPEPSCSSRSAIAACTSCRDSSRGSSSPGPPSRSRNIPSASRRAPNVPTGSSSASRRSVTSVAACAT